MDSKKIVLGIFTIAMIFLFGLRIGGEQYTQIVEIANYVTLAVLIVFAYQTINYFSFRSDIGKSVCYIALGAVTWTIADITYFSAWISENLYQLPDILYLLGYIFIILGILKAIKIVDSQACKRKTAIAITAGIGIIALVIFFSLVPFSIDPEVGAWTAIINALYIIGDIVILVCTLFLLWSARKTTFAKAWTWIGIGALITFVADIIYTLATDYNSGDPVELLYILGYVAFAFGFILLKELAQKELEGPQTTTPPPSSPIPAVTTTTENTTAVTTPTPPTKQTKKKLPSKRRNTSKKAAKPKKK